MRRTPPIIVSLVCLALTGAAAAQPAPRGGKHAAGRMHYFVDFRARGGGVFGHAYVVYGRTDAHGRVLERHYAGLYPREPFDRSPLLPVLLVPGKVTAKAENDPRQPPTAIYRRGISAAQFVHLRATVRRLHAKPALWHLTFHNCNDFVAKLAHALGLLTPPALQAPEDFVQGIAMMNGG